jgi:hypothetical protein
MGRPLKYTKLSEKDWLINLYLKERKSTVAIAKLIGCDARSVNGALKKFNIEIRNLSESHLSNKFELIKDWDVINGSLLGDASLLWRNRKTGQGGASFSKTNKNFDHVLFVAKSIYGDFGESRIGPNCKSLDFYHRFRTVMHVELTKAYKEWYPASNNYVKIVPRTLDLTPKMILHWFMDDGFSLYRSDSNSLRIGLCTECFNKSDNLFLIEQLNDKFHLNARLTKTGTHGAAFGQRIAIPGGKWKEFFNLIGPCPVPSLAYKWKAPKI